MKTGDVDAYLLYKQMNEQNGQEEVFQQASVEELPELEQEL